MAVNPMQRKANNSFLLGVLITLLIASVIIGFLILQVSKLNKEKTEIEKTKVTVYTLSTDLKSGEIMTSDMLMPLRVESTTIPSNAIRTLSDFSDYSLCDSEGRTIIRSADDKYTLIISDQDRKELALDEELDQYYYMNDNQKVYVTLDESTVIAKVDLKANTVVTTDFIKKGEALTADVRTQEYNVISLPSQLTTGEFIDIRLRLPSGQDYIVVSHKEVTIPTINGVDSTNCIWVNMSELETLTMSSAIIEAYKSEGSKLYATRYVEAGLQEAATTTYIPSDSIIALIESDSNVVNLAKNKLYTRMNTKVSTLNDEKVKDIVRNPINSAINNEDAQDLVIDGVQEEVQGLQEERELYLESIGG